MVTFGMLTVVNSAIIMPLNIMGRWLDTLEAAITLDEHLQLEYYLTFNISILNVV